MSIKKRNFDPDREKKAKISLKKRDVLDKHRKLIYDIATSKLSEDDLDDDLNYAYISDSKFKRR